MNIDDDYWTITKHLKRSDVNRSSRLLLGQKLVRDHMLPYMGRDFDEKRGKQLTVYDVDTQTLHTLVLKTWATRSYVLINGWLAHFVRRRGLNVNDMIGLRWKEADGRFEFSVLYNDAIYRDLADIVDGL